MKHLLPLLIFVAGFLTTNAQRRPDIDGKWYGYALQGPGELCTTCNFELEIAQKKNITGTTHTWQKDTVDIRIGFWASFDSTDTLRIKESENWVINRYIRQVIPDSTIGPCVKEIYVKYQKIGDGEYLLGRGIGEELDERNQRTGRECIPALFVFARQKTDLEAYLRSKKDSLLATISHQDAEDAPLPEFVSSFHNTEIRRVTEIQAEHQRVEIRLRDYLREDNDTVSVYVNRKLVSSQRRISKTALVIPITLRAGELNEVLVYADNLGLVPPNTSEMYVVDGKKAYRIMIESDKQKTAAVYIRYKEP